MRESLLCACLFRSVQAEGKDGEGCVWVTRRSSGQTRTRSSAERSLARPVVGPPRLPCSMGPAIHVILDLLK